MKLRRHAFSLLFLPLRCQCYYALDKGLRGFAFSLTKSVMLLDFSVFIIFVIGSSLLVRLPARFPFVSFSCAIKRYISKIQLFMLRTTSRRLFSLSVLPVTALFSLSLISWKLWIFRYLRSYEILSSSHLFPLTSAGLSPLLLSPRSEATSLMRNMVVIKVHANFFDSVSFLLIPSVIQWFFKVFNYSFRAFFVYSLIHWVFYKCSSIYILGYLLFNLSEYL